MYNQNSIIVQNMINNGDFGQNQPMQPSYNPYSNMNTGYNNMVPINQIQNYGNMNQQQFVFSPVASYDYNAQLRNDAYYNPYGNTFSNVGGYNYNATPYYNNGFGYNPAAYNKYIQEQTELSRLKYKIAATVTNANMTDADITNILTTKHESYRKLSDDDKIELAEYEFIKRVVDSSGMPQPETNAQRTARALYEISYNKHKELDDHSLCTFLEEDLWKLEREFWIAENIAKPTRNLNTSYSSNDYSDLLDMHRSSNPFVNDLLNTSKYDNNLDDIEIGMNIAFEAERQRRTSDILNGKIPAFISSPEVVERRRRFTEQAMAQIYQKNGGVNNV